jgi:outer membrane protein assembly factor BamE (lipoprotein component of BamABCDE complex)
LALLRPAATLLLVTCLAGCGVFSAFRSERTTRGNIVPQDALKELIPGTSSRADVTTLLGSPTAKATFDDNTWIYIGQITASRIGRVPGVDMQKVVVLNFSQDGTLTSIRQLDHKDAKPVAMAAGATPSPGSEASFMQQLLGNVGKFTPAGLPGGDTGGSAPGPGATSGAGNTLP